MAATPIPPILDQDRYVRYEPVAPTTDFDVPFPYFGTDASELLVLVDGVKVTAFTVLSRSAGSLASAVLPVEDAFVRLGSAAASVSVEIYGSIRPRRTVQATAAFSTRDFNFVFSYVIAALREMWSQFTRAVQVPPGESTVLLPTATDRAGKVLGFSADGTPRALEPAEGGVVLVGPDNILNGAVTLEKIAPSVFKSDGTAGAPVKYGADGSLFAKYLSVVTGAAANIGVQAAAGFGAALNFWEGTTFKWQLVKNADNTFGLYSAAASTWAWIVNAANVLTFANSPLAPTPATGDRSTKLATTQFVGNELAVAGWTLLGVWDGASAAQIDFTGLGGYSELRIVGRVGKVSGRQYLYMRFSPDNGATWRTSGYLSSYFEWGNDGSTVASNETDGIRLSPAPSSNTTTDIFVSIVQFGAALKTMVSATLGDPVGTNNKGRGFNTAVYDTAEAHSAIRFACTSNNLSGGFIRVYGRN